ncbi:SDR family NAD(P)-dependent oxidoreductase [Actinokineospora xionganensis]|uniref:SDR family NAD(P)-dependent oxidoreductase n=1 Tax=Actinokineospora xionganensis TaxID=2684470 RepID=UPI001C9D006C|nr:SDR family oxidoreductase [Actinokineospora xionganensis]
MTATITRRAWITGGASGIGAGVAGCLAERGVDVVVIDRDADRLAEIAESVPGAERWHLDVTETDEVLARVADLPPERMPDILVNCVGGDTRRIPVADLRESDLLDAMTANVLGSFTLTRLCVPAMRTRGWGRVVNLASIAGRTYSIFSNAAYVAAKAAVIGYTKQCAHELAASGVTVNAVAHGPIATQRLVAAREEMAPERRADVLGRLPMGRYGTVPEAVGAVVHLCGEDAGYTTGSVLDVNGGLHI